MEHMTDAYGLFISGDWVVPCGEGSIKVVNPCDRQEVVGRVGIASEEQVDQTVCSAYESFLEWRETPASGRAKVMRTVAEALRQHAEELGELVRRETGRVAREAPGEATGTASLFDYFAEEALRLRGGVPQSNDRDRLVLILKEPVGVVAAITPWNNPLYLLGRILAPALAVGCTVVAKPSSAAPLSTLRMAEIAYRAGLPPGAFNVVTGPGRETGESLITHPKVAKVGLTGGLVAGRRAMELAAQDITSVTLELGGQCPAVVCEDADVDAAAEAIAFQAFRQGGQVCNRVNRVYAQQAVYHQLRGKLTDLISQLVVGDSLDEQADFAALMNEAGVSRSEEHVQDAVDKGAIIETGGCRLTEGKFAKGYFFAPTLVSGCRQNMRLIQEETFGPVLGLAQFDDFEQALELANDSIYGLSAFLFTTDMTRAFRGVRALEAGTVWVNDIHLTYPQCPYGGYKQSGLGRTQGSETLEDYLETKTVYWDTSGRRRKHKPGH